MNKGRIFVISGPSGSGKDTLLKRVFSEHPEIGFSISSISRPMRENEREGEKYHFISREEFLSLIENDELLEYNEFCGNFYGTPKRPVYEFIKNGRDVILELDVNGAAKVRSVESETVSVFIMPPSYIELKKRLCGRGTEKESVIEERLTLALGEIRRAVEYDYIVVNDDINKAADDLMKIITSDKLRLSRQKYIIDEVLKNVKSCDR